MTHKVPIRSSSRTAEGHVDHIRDKLGMRSRAEVAVWVVQNQSR